MPGHFKYRIIQGTGRIRRGEWETGRMRRGDWETGRIRRRDWKNMRIEV